MTVLRGWALWRAWFVWVTAGELVGFAVPAVVGALLAVAPLAVGLPSFLAAGAVEGGILGYAQSRVLSRALPRVPVSGWIVATVAGAVVAWLVGLVPGYAWPLAVRLPWPVLVLAGTVLGSVLLLSIGTAQWYVLRPHVPRAGWWIAATAGGWLAGLAVFVAVSTPLWRPGQSWPVIAAIGVLAGAAMAATMSALTGLALVRLLHHAADHGLEPPGRTAMGASAVPDQP